MGTDAQAPEGPGEPAPQRETSSTEDRHLEECLNLLAGPSDEKR